MHFIHTGDLHLGAAPDANTAWAKERAVAVRNTLPRIVALAKMEKADLLLITGDLFNRIPIHKELKDINYYFSQIPKTRIVITAGNHDYITDNSPYNDFAWAPNVTFIATPYVSSVYFADINTEVHGFSYHSRDITDPILDGIRAPKDDRIHILMAHCGDPEHVPVKLAALARSGFDYVALGHIHKPRIFKNTRMAYCGSPEPLDNTDIGPRGLLSGDVTKTGFDLRWRRIAERQYREIGMTVEPETLEPELLDRLREEIARHPDDIYRITLNGARAPEVSFDADAISQLAKVSKVIDNTEPEYNIGNLLLEHSGDLIARFISELQDSEDDPVRRNALYYGLNALLDSN